MSDFVAFMFQNPVIVVVTVVFVAIAAAFKVQDNEYLNSLSPEKRREIERDRERAERAERDQIEIENGRRRAADERAAAESYEQSRREADEHAYRSRSYP